MADAYLHASKGHYSPEIDTLRKIDRFGVEAVMGRRVLYFGETRRMILAENIAAAYMARKQASTWAQWSADNPAMAAVLKKIEMNLQE